MQDPIVKKLFHEQIKEYSKGQSSNASPLIRLFSAWQENRLNNNLEIGEFGGAAGQLLVTVGGNFPQAKLTNIEIIEGYRRQQVSKKIKFLNRSILDSGLPDHSFDVLLARDVLHHLIGQNSQETKDNQVRAVRELKRLLKPGGIILIEELTNRSATVCRIIYYLSRLNSKIGLRLSNFEISPHTIVYPLTPRELTQLLAQELKIKKTFVLYKNPRPWRSWFTHLFSPYGKFIAQAQK